jgi:hypothetical protein
MIKPRRIIWRGHAVCMGIEDEGIEGYGGKATTKEITWKPRCR